MLKFAQEIRTWSTFEVYPQTHERHLVFEMKLWYNYTVSDLCTTFIAYHIISHRANEIRPLKASVIGLGAVA